MNPFYTPYTLTMIAAVLTGSWLLRGSQKSLPLTASEKLGLGIGCFCGAMIGAKLPFVFSNYADFLSGVAWFAHGKTIICGLVGGYFGVELAKWVMEIRTKTGDTFAVPVAISVAIGRLACFQGGCCFGTETNLPWGVCFPMTDGDNLIFRHPTQLYEALFHLCMALVLLNLLRRNVFSGQLVKFYFICYFGYRFLTEWIRPEPEIVASLTGYQWGAIIFIPVFAWLWYKDAAALKREATVQSNHNITG
ncbi:MAG: diacylglyceryl transferase [Blastopirellula sp.]|nr:MAG: diacylglyceryl transferase [Blastopirellula sp.]